MKIKTITRTALFIALLIAVQAVTRSLGQFVTGSCVNLILAVCAALCGPVSALIVALVSPFCAFLLGIGPAFIQIIPLVAAGNAVYALLIRLALRQKTKAAEVILIAAAACAKAAFLYIGIVKLVLPMLVSAGRLPAPKQAVLAASFSWPQLVTALIGGILAFLTVPPLKKALSYNE